MLGFRDAQGTGEQISVWGFQFFPASSKSSFTGSSTDHEPCLRDLCMSNRMTDVVQQVQHTIEVRD